MSTNPSRMGKPKEIRSALSIYRTMAVIAGIALFILIAEMIMKYTFHQDNFLTRNWSYIHGFIYMGYAAAVGNLGLKCGWRLWRIVKNLLAGFVPVVPWIAEQRNAKEINELLDGGYVAGTASTAGVDA